MIPRLLRPLWLLPLVALAAGPVRAQDAVPPALPAAEAPASAPAAAASMAAPAPASPAATPRVLEETAALALRDSRGAEVTLRIPLALNRPANAFRLHGARPLTLKNRERRRDLYRDAFLELATRSRLSPGTTAWEPLVRQMEWFLNQNPNVQRMGAAQGLKLNVDLGRPLEGVPGYRHFSALSKALGLPDLKPQLPLDITEPVTDALKLRALATDEAERRLTGIGAALSVESAGVDPALRDGYRLARAEFDQVRQGLWPALAASVRRHQGKLVLSAARDLAFSHLGAWAIFGYMGWKGVEGVFNAEYQGQYAVALATVAALLAEAAAKSAEHLPSALYAEYALNYQLTEALKGGQLMDLKPVGGSAAPWQIRATARLEELRQSLAAK